MVIATIDVDAMTTGIVMTVGASARCPRSQEHRRGPGVVPDPDNWLATGTVSAGGGHGPILFGESEVGGAGVHFLDP